MSTSASLRVGKIACAVALGISSACAPPAPPNVLLISIDSLRADHLGAYGYDRPTSPSIDSLADAGTVYETALSTTTWTLPAHASMLTALYPEVHGVSKDGTKLSESAVLVSEMLHDAGYYTGAVVSAPYLHRDYGFDQGWDVYDDEPFTFDRRPQNFNPTHWGTTSPAVHARAVDLLGQAAGRPFFLFVHYWDVHYDYAAPPPYDRMFDPGYAGGVTSLNFEFNDEIHPAMDPLDLRHVVALYDGEIAYTDSYVGRLLAELERLNLWDNTMVVLTSDHGDEFFEHGQKGHRKNLFGTTLNVPLIIKWPARSSPATRVDVPVSLVDVVPTILEVTGLPPLEWTRGTELLSLIDGSPSAVRYRFASLFDRLKAVVGGDLKLISRWSPTAQHGERPQLFDLRHDPNERNNLAADREDARTRLSHAQSQWLAIAEHDARSVEGIEFEPDPELADRLRSLGYIR